MTYQKQLLQTKLDSQVQVKQRKLRFGNCFIGLDRTRVNLTFAGRSTPTISTYYGTTTSTGRCESTVNFESE